MSERITKKMVEAKLSQLSKELGRPEAAVVDDAEGRRFVLEALILDKSYGGYSVQEIVSDGGGRSEVGHGYRMTAREAYYMLRGMIAAARMMQGK